MIIRPTDDGVNDEFWVAIAGSDIDWETLSKSPQHFIDAVKKLSGLHSMQVLETLTLNYYRYTPSDIRLLPDADYGPVGLIFGW